MNAGLKEYSIAPTETATAYPYPMGWDQVSSRGRFRSAPFSEEGWPFQIEPPPGTEQASTVPQSDLREKWARHISRENSSGSQLWEDLIALIARASVNEQINAEQADKSLPHVGERRILSAADIAVFDEALFASVHVVHSGELG